MASQTKGGTGFDPAAVERAEWLAQRDLGAPVPGSTPREAVAGWQGGSEPPGHWRRFLRDNHPPRFKVPGGVEVSVARDGDSESFAATAAFGLHLHARTEAAFAALPGRPGWRCYVAHGASASPAAAATFTDGPIVLLAIDATEEAGLRSASRAALLHHVIGDAIESGARIIGARVDERDEKSRRDAAAGLLLAGFESAYECPRWVDAGLPAS
jgi:hypothetical protein